MPITHFVVVTPEDLAWARSNFGDKMAQRMADECAKYPCDEPKQRRACARLLREFVEKGGLPLDDTTIIGVLP